MLSDTDRHFVQARQRRNRFGRVAIPVGLIVWLAFFAWLFFQVPLLANPFDVVDRLQRSTIAPGTLGTMSSLLPVVVDLLAVLFVVSLLLMWSWVRLEQRYLRLLQRLQ